MSLTSSDQPAYYAPLFEHMAHMNDEAIWELLSVLYGLIDAYEAHYAEPLQRLRLAAISNYMSRVMRSGKWNCL